MNQHPDLAVLGVAHGRIGMADNADVIPAVEGKRERDQHQLVDIQGGGLRIERDGIRPGDRLGDGIDVVSGYKGIFRTEPWWHAAGEYGQLPRLVDVTLVVLV